MVGSSSRRSFFALTIVFLVLAAQFESFVHPAIIMVTVPLALLGAVSGLKAYGGTINIFSQIAVIMLIGIAAKNGVLIVEFANQLRDRGVAFQDAIVLAASKRMRPILMTSLCTAFGAVPFLFATGSGAEQRKPHWSRGVLRDTGFRVPDAFCGARRVLHRRPRHETRESRQQQS